jgi:peptide subunit release factor 1 (eRF1)
MLWMLMVLPVASQTISKGEIKTIVNQKGDTLVVMHLNDAKKILTDLLHYEVTDSLLNVYVERDSLNSEKIFLKDELILKLNLQNENYKKIVINLETVVNNKDQIILFKDKTIEQQGKEIKKQKLLRNLGFVGCVVLPIITLIIAL